MNRLPIRLRTPPGRCIAVLFAMLVGVPFGTTTARTFQLPFSTASQTPNPAVARINVAETGATSHGTGTLVNVAGQHGLVVTNWHVVRDAAGEIHVEFPDGFRSAARILKIDKDWDLAALQIWRPAVEPIPLATSAPRPGDRLTIAGYGSGQYRNVSGRCTQYVAPGANMPYEMVELSAEARQGDSGGPIFNARGELAGVLFGASRGTTSGSYCGRVSIFLASVLQDAGHERQLANGFVGMGSGQQTADLNGYGSFQTENAAPRNGTRTVIEGAPAVNRPPNFDVHIGRTIPDVPHSPQSTDQPSPTGSYAGVDSYFGTSPRMTPAIDLSPPQDASSLAAPAVRHGTPLGGTTWRDSIDGQPILSATKTTPTPWEGLVGETPLEQGKSILAGIGILAVLLRLSNVLAGGRD